MKAERSRLSQARSLIVYWGNKELGISGIELTKYFEMTKSSVSSAIKRGGKIAYENEYLII